MKQSRDKNLDRVTTVCIAIATTLVLSFGIIASHGIPMSEIFKYWIRDFLVGCSISIPLGLVMNPLIIKLIYKLTKK
jgi:hypothetical protein